MLIIDMLLKYLLNKGGSKHANQRTITFDANTTQMFVRKVRMDYIFHFLIGYRVANAKLPVDNMDRNFCSWFGKWLLIWIENNVDSKYRATSAAWYDDIIRITPRDRMKLTSSLIYFYITPSRIFAIYRQPLDDIINGNYDSTDGIPGTYYDNQ